MNNPKLWVCFMAYAIICGYQLVGRIRILALLKFMRLEKVSFIYTFVLRSVARERSSFVLHLRLIIKLLLWFFAGFIQMNPET